MANTNAPFGFQPWAPMEGTVGNLGFTPRKIYKSDTTAIFKGDPVFTQTTGYISQAVRGTTQIAGVFWGGCYYYSTAGKIPLQNIYWPGTTDAAADPYPALIIANANATFLVQTGNSNTTASPATLANIGMTANFSFTNSGVGNTSTGMSVAYLDLYQANDTTTQPFKILRLGSEFLEAGSPGSDPATAYNWVLVGFNFSESRSLNGHA